MQTLVRIQCLENLRVPPQGSSTEGESGLENQQCFVSRDVIFHETIFPYNKACKARYMQPQPVVMPNDDLEKAVIEEVYVEGELSLENDDEIGENEDETDEHDKASTREETGEAEETHTAETQTDQEPHANAEPVLRRSTR